MEGLVGFGLWDSSNYGQQVCSAARRRSLGGMQEPCMGYDDSLLAAVAEVCSGLAGLGCDVVGWCNAPYFDSCRTVHCIMSLGHSSMLW